MPETSGAHAYFEDTAFSQVRESTFNLLSAANAANAANGNARRCTVPRVQVAGDDFLERGQPSQSRPSRPWELTRVGTVLLLVATCAAVVAWACLAPAQPEQPRGPLEPLREVNWEDQDQKEPNPPTWPSSVRVFGPQDDPKEIQDAVDQAYKVNGGYNPPNNGEFSARRFAFLFKPGHYAVEVPVGYYTQVAGLGDIPSDVVFTSKKGVYCEQGNYNSYIGARNNFWRSAENFHTNASFNWFENASGMLWTVSQGSPLRRVVVERDLLLYFYNSGDGRSGYASGGFMANMWVKGAVMAGSQQQFVVRNSDIGDWTGGVLNVVFVGTFGAPNEQCGWQSSDGSSPSYVKLESAAQIAEKPFISIEAGGAYMLNVPDVQAGTRGYHFVNWRKVDFGSVYVATAAHDTAQSINAKLARGLNVVLSPGIYHVDAPLELGSPDQVLLGLGMATVVATHGTAAISVTSGAEGARVAGVLLEAGAEPIDALLQWGSRGSPGNAQKPGFLHDVFMRVGGTGGPGGTGADVKVMLRIDSDHVIGDNVWLWRADHSGGDGDVAPVTGGASPCQNGLVVNGNHVTMYSLVAEHTLQDQVLWNGDNGQTYFFHSALPFDATLDFSRRNYTAYRIHSGVKWHTAYGVGVHHFFRDSPVQVESAIVAPPHLEHQFVSPHTLFIGGQGTMKHIVNSRGGETSARFATCIHPTLCSNKAEFVCLPLPPYETAVATTTPPTGAQDGAPAPPDAASWIQVDGGTNRACRPLNDALPLESYFVVHEAASLEQCQELCVKTPFCKGIEHGFKGRCEVWLQDIGNTMPVGGYRCMRYSVPALSTQTTATTMTYTTVMKEFLSAGKDRGCLSRDALTPTVVDYVLYQGLPTLDQCKQKCTETFICKGIEYKPDRCHVWVRRIEHSVAAVDSVCMRYEVPAPLF